MKESEIRPASLFEKYLQLSMQDAGLYFQDHKRLQVACPGCGSNDSTYEFEKHGFQYVTCESCETLFQSPRPPQESFEAFYQNSESSIYWSEVFFPAVAEARKEKIFRPRVEKMAALCSERGLDPKVTIDVGAGYGLFLEGWRDKFPGSNLIAIEPSANLASICREKKFDVVESIAEKADSLNGKADCLVCFEVLEHVYSPIDFIKTLSDFLVPGGVMMVSTLGVDGFDIQMLWEKSNSISPPHHINFLSRKGFLELFSRVGLVDVAILTPGVLDVDIVRNATKNDPEILRSHKFIKNVIEDENLGDNFQQFLIDNDLSSHTWVVAKKP